MAKTPTSRTKEGATAGSSTSPSPSPRKASTSSLPPRGPTPQSAETSYHKRLRSALLEYKKYRREWSELVIRGIVARAKAAIELSAEIETALKHIHSGAVRTGYLFAQSEKLSEQLGAIHAVLESLEEVTDAMQDIVDKVDALVLEASTTRGMAFAFKDPLWVTWPLSRFADGLAELHLNYGRSYGLIRNLSSTVTSFPSLPPAFNPNNPSSSKEEKESTKPSAEEVQAALSLIAVQPLLPGKGSDNGAEAWEELLAVEVGGWT